MAKLVSTNIELAALRGMCSPNKAISGKLVAGLDETYFHNEEAIDAYKKITKCITEDGEPPSWSGLKEDPSLSEDTREFLGNLRVKIRKTGQVMSAIRILNRYRKLRGLYLLGEDVVNNLQAKRVDEEDMLERVSDTITKLRVNKSIKDLALHFGKGNNSYDLVKDMVYNDSDDHYIPSGFRDFDIRNGGFFLKSLITIAGSTGGGKSALSSQLAINWARLGIPTVLVPLEMSKEEQTGRILANLSGIDIRKILLKRLTKEEKEIVIQKYKKFVRRANKKGGRYTIFKPQQDMTIEEILSIVPVYGPKVIIVDYISLLKGVSDENQWLKLGNVARYCKIFASNNNCIIVLVAQLSEEGKVRYSRAISEHSDYAWYFMATKETKENEIMNIEQGKGRNAELFPFSLRAQLSTMRIGDLSREETEALSAKRNKEKTDGKPKSGYIDDIADAE